jgi:hypothetical protein
MEWLAKRKAKRFTAPPPMRPVNSAAPPMPSARPTEGLDIGSYFECEFARPVDPDRLARTDQDAGDPDMPAPSVRAAYLQTFAPPLPPQ